MFGSRLVTIAVQMCLIFVCELWLKAPGTFWNWTGKLLEFFSSKRVGTLRFFTGWMSFLSPSQQCQSTEGNSRDLIQLKSPTSLIVTYPPTDLQGKGCCSCSTVWHWYLI